jgi:hypothetical protein
MKKKFKFSLLAIIIGIILTLLSLSIYLFYNVGWLGSIQSEIAGVGIAILVIGLGFKLFGVKLG